MSSHTDEEFQAIAERVIEATYVAAAREDCTKRDVDKIMAELALTVR